MKNTAVLLLNTPIPLARKGAVAAITHFLVTHNAARRRSRGQRAGHVPVEAGVGWG